MAVAAIGPGQRLLEPLAPPRRRPGQRDLVGGQPAPHGQFDHALLQAAIADGHPQRHADRAPSPRTSRPVVRRGHPGSRRRPPAATDRAVRWRHRAPPPTGPCPSGRSPPRTARCARGQMMPFSSWFCSMAGAEQPGDADAVAAHFHRLGLAVLVDEVARSSPPNTWCRGRTRGRPRCRAGSPACPCRRATGRRRRRCGCRR